MLGLACIAISMNAGELCRRENSANLFVLIQLTNASEVGPLPAGEVGLLAKPVCWRNRSAGEVGPLAKSVHESLNECQPGWRTL